MQTVLTVNMENTAVSFALYSGTAEASEATPRASFRISMLPQRTADEYAVLLSAMMKRAGDGTAVDCVIVASVVPACTGELCDALRLLYPDAALLTVGAGLRSGLTIRTENPAELGADLVAMSVGATALQEPPFLVLDCSAVTTLSAVDADKGSPAFLGCSILPGPALGAEALKARTALLSDVLLQSPKRAIGKNSAESLRSGLILGYAAAVNELIDSFSAELGAKGLPVIVTGEYAAMLKPMLPGTARTDVMLAHRGLYKMALLNAAKCKKAPERG